MNITVDTPIEILNGINKGSVMEALGIEYIEVSDGFVKGQMPIDHRTIQPAGILSGGASLAFAETLGGLGSALLIDLEKYSAVGTQVAANHVGVGIGKSVRGEARIIHRGKRTHVWNIDIISEDERLVSTVRMTNQIIER